MIMGTNKVSRSALAEATGISRPSLANKLDGKVSFTYDEVIRVIETLGIAWEDLLGEHDDEPFRLRDFKPRPDRRL